MSNIIMNGHGQWTEEFAKHHDRIMLPAIKSIANLVDQYIKQYGGDGQDYTLLENILLNDLVMEVHWHWTGLLIKMREEELKSNE